MKQLPLLAMLEQRTAMLAILEGTPTFTGSYLEYRSEGVTLRPVPGGALVVGDLGITGSKCLRTQADAFTKAWRQFFPDARLTGSWVRQDVYSRDGMPLVGPLEKRDSHLLVATGLSGWGLTGSYLAARLLCRNILGRSQPEARFFLPHRSYAKKFAVMLPGALREAGAMAAMVFHRDMPKCTHMGCRLRYFPRHSAGNAPATARPSPFWERCAPRPPPRTRPSAPGSGASADALRRPKASGGKLPVLRSWVQDGFASFEVCCRCLQHPFLLSGV